MPVGEVDPVHVVPPVAGLGEHHGALCAVVRLGAVGVSGLDVVLQELWAGQHLPAHVAGEGLDALVALLVALPAARRGEALAAVGEGALQ